MAALVAAASLIAGGCAASGWRPAAREPARRFVGSQVRILTDGGWLTLHVTDFVPPFLEGVAEPGSGEVLLPLDWIAAAELGPDRRHSRSQAGLTEAELRDRRVQFVTHTGVVALHVIALRDGYVRGRPIACWAEAPCRGRARVLLRDVSEIRTSSPVAGHAGAVIGVLGAALAGWYLFQHLVFYVALLLVGDM